MHLVHVAERLEDESVDAAAEQALNLAGEQRLRLELRGGTERLDADAERSDRADDARLAARRRARQLGGRAVDLFRLVGQPVAVELERVGPESVRLEDLRAGAHVFGVHFLHEPRLLQVQLVVADVEEEALAVEHGAHGPVEDVDTAVGKEGSEGNSHRGK